MISVEDATTPQMIKEPFIPIEPSETADKGLMLRFGGGDDSDSEEEDDVTFNFEIENKDASAIVEEDEDYTFNEPMNSNPSNESDSEESSDEEDIIDPEAVKNVIVENIPVQNAIVMEETEPEELIMDFEVEDEPENILVIDEALIPEDKVIATYKQQSEDLFNQLVKINGKLTNKQLRVIKNFEYLKKMYSVIDPEGNVISEKLKTDKYKPFQKILNSEMYTPIVNETKEIYSFINDEDGDEIIEENENELDFQTTLENFNEIEKKYKFGQERINYSFMSHINELFNLVDSYYPEEPGFNQTLVRDTNVVSNTFTNDIV